MRSLPPRFRLSLSGAFSVSFHRSAESFKFWRSPSPRSPDWSFPPAGAESAAARGTKGRKPSRRRRPRPPGTPWPTTASRQPGPTKSASHDLRRNFLVPLPPEAPKLPATLTGSAREVRSNAGREQADGFIPEHAHKVRSRKQGVLSAPPIRRL